MLTALLIILYLVVVKNLFYLLPILRFPILSGFLLFVMLACTPETPSRSVASPRLDSLQVSSSINLIDKDVDSIPVGLQRLVTAYPQQQLRATSNALIWPDGFALPYRDSGSYANFWDSLERPDLALQLAQAYPKDSSKAPPARNHDPGRIRVDAFFKKMYGADKAAVKKHLVAVDFLGTKVWVTSINGVDERLKAVVKALQQHPAWHRYCLPTAGTFNWRSIAGTTRQSSHSYGTAIDLNVQYADYWRWAVGKHDGSAKRPIRYRNRMPLGLVQLFEREGFIWGGNWYHYDTMHFEYRPELL